MFRKVFIFVFLLIAAHAFAQQADFKLYLVGDAGENEITGETLDSLKSKLLHNPESAIVFLGDNSYKNTFFGLAEGFKGFDSSRITQRKLNAQLDILKGYKGYAYFVPGNHDWWNKKQFAKGKRGLKMEESFIETNLGKNTTLANPTQTFLPKNGSPGPVSVELDNNKVRIVFIDTYWLILLGFKDNPAQNIALANTFYHNLDSVLALATALHQNVVIVAHHPVSHLGTVMAKPFKHPYFMGRLKQNSQTFPSYDTMAARINAILTKYPDIYYASGHIHALQYFTLKNTHYIISGAGSKTIPVKTTQDDSKPTVGGLCELWNDKGFFEIDFYKDYTPAVKIYHSNGRESIDIKQPEAIK